MTKFFNFCLYLILVIFAAGLFGALHDQISYTISSEYYTLFKFPMFHVLNPTVPVRIRVAEVGFLASWWMGIPLGLLTGVAGFIHEGADQMRSALFRSIPVLMGFALLFALGGLLYGCIQTQTIDLSAYGGWFIPNGVQNLRRYLCVGYMHNSAYLGGVAVIPVAWAFHILVKQRNETNK